MTDSHQILGYDVLATLGYGARSTIFAVKDSDDHVYAMKRVIKQSQADQRFLDQAEQEHEIASQFAHPFLRRSYRLFKQRKLLRVSEIYVLMELVDGLTFEQYKTADLIELCQLCQQVSKGLAAMHELGYVHADIKPNNILITGKHQVKIIDFGQSCPAGTVKQRIQGTPDYIAPEQVLRRELGPATDVFNLGATMYWLLTRQHIPTLIPKGQVGVSLKTDSTIRPPADVNPDIPPALSSLIMHCLQQEPIDRPQSMDLVHERLELSIAQLRRRQGGDGQGNGNSGKSPDSQDDNDRSGTWHFPISHLPAV